MMTTVTFDVMIPKDSNVQHPYDCCQCWWGLGLGLGQERVPDSSAAIMILWHPRGSYFVRWVMLAPGKFWETHSPLCESL